MESIEKANQYLRHYVEEKAGYKMRRSEIQDFCLTGEVDENDIEGYADDFISELELETEAAEYKTHLKDFGYGNDSPSLDMNMQY